MLRPSLSLRIITPIIGLILVFLGPIFFYFTLMFLRKVDYAAATLAFLAGWSLLRAGVDLTRAALAAQPTTESHQSKKKRKEKKTE